MKQRFLIGAAAILLISGCVSEEKTKQTVTGEKMAEQTGTEKDHTEEIMKELSPEEVVAETKKQLNTKVPVRLPKTLTVSTEYHLTAKTTSDQDHYMVEFLETKEPIPINNAKLKDVEGNVAILKGTRYETAAMAAEHVERLEPAIGNPPVDLGHGIKGYYDAGAGSQYLSWIEGNWTLVVRGRTEQAGDLSEEAKEIVEYLEYNTLPPPDAGNAKFTSKAIEKGSQILLWHKDNIVYKIETNRGYLDALKIAVSMNDNKGN